MSFGKHDLPGISCTFSCPCCSASGSHPLVERLLLGHPTWVSEVSWTTKNRDAVSGSAISQKPCSIVEVKQLHHWMDSADSFMYDRLMIPIDNLWQSMSIVSQVFRQSTSHCYNLTSTDDWEFVRAQVAPSLLPMSTAKTLWVGRRRTEGLTWTDCLHPFADYFTSFRYDQMC